MRYHNSVWDNCSIFVFGSNLAGRHGAGAAKYAMQNCGARYGTGVGFSGNSYAIPTKDLHIKTFSLNKIHYYINQFLIAASEWPDCDFFVTRVGCGLAGYKDEDIAPMFKGAQKNCILPIEWKVLTSD